MTTVHSAKAVDFSTLGLGALMPVDAEVEERAGAMFQITMTHPMDATGKWWNLQKYNILKAPAPMRETPYLHIEGISEPGTTVTREIYKVRTNTGARLRLRSKPSLSAPIIKSYYPGTEVVRVSVDGDWARVIICSGGATGYMWNGYLTYVRTESETVPGEDVPAVVVQPRQTREQLFRIDSIEKDDARQQISVTALHISYDLAKNTVKGECVLEKVPAKQAVAEIMNRASNEHSFTVYCNIDAEVSGDFSGLQIAAALWGDNGIVQQTGARLIRDNYDIFILADEVRDRGVEIRHGKNLTGAIMTEDVSDVTTRIIPLGRDKDGNRLMIDGDGYIDSPRSGDVPIVSSREIEYDVRVGTDGIETEAQAKVKLAELAAADFENGADGAVVGLDVDFIALEDTAEYERYSALQTVHLYDTVHVISTPSMIRAGIRVNGYRFRVTGRRPRYTAVTLGEITELETTVYGYDIADGTLSGTKILPGSADGSILRNATIQYAKIAQAAIDKLAANAITAVRADINKIVAGEITTDQLYVDLATIAIAQITTANIDKANIDWAEIKTLTAKVAEIVEAEIDQVKIDWAEIENADIDWANIATLNAQIAAVAEAKIQDAKITVAQIDQLDAAVAKIVSATIATGDFDLAAIKNLLADAFVLEQGVADSIYIKNLAVTAANLLSATLGELVLKGSDGRYYKIVVGSDGTITTERVSVTNDEISAGTMNGGQMIVETTANIADLNATTIKGSQAVLDTILTQSLTAGKITAGQALIASATIPTLYVTSVNALGNSIDFSANKSIRLMVSQRSKVYRRGKAPEGALPGDLWIQPSTGYTYQAVGSEDGAPEFSLSDDGYLMYRYANGETEYPVEIDENGWLVIDSNSPFRWTASSDGILTAWSRVKDGDLTSAELSITDTKIALEALKTSYDEQGEHIADLEADLTVQAEKIEGKVSQTIYDEGIATLEASIAEQAGLIESKVSQTVYEAEKANHSKVFRQEHPPQGAKVGDLWVQPSTNYTYQAVGSEDGAPEFYLTDDGYLMYRYADGETEYQLIIDEDGWLVIEEDAPFVWASNDDGSLTAWSRVKDGDLTSAETIIRQNTEEIELRVRKATYDLEKVYRSDVAPEDPAKDLMWLDTSITPPILKKWDGETWVAVGAQDVKNSSVTINDEQVLIDTGEFILRLHDPDDAENVLMEMSADGNGGFTQLYAQKIYSPSVVSIYEGASVAVSSAAELEALLQDLRGKYISAPLTINIFGLTSGNFELYGIDGPGDINIIGGVVDASNCTINSLTVTRCRARIDVENVTISTSGTAVSVDASTVRLTGCVINAANGIVANFGATVEAENCTGACAGFLAIPQHGSSMFFTGEIPVGLPDLSGTGNIYTDAVFTAVPAEEEPEELPTITTVTLKPTLTKTFRGSSWRDTYYLWQGRYGSASLSRGCMWFDTSAFAGKTILSATLRLTRMTGSGAGVFVTTNIYGTTATGASGTPAIGTKYASVDLDQGQTRTVDVTNAIAALAAGTIKGLMLYDGSTENLSTASPYTRHYAKYYGYDHSSGPQLTVTYK